MTGPDIPTREVIDWERQGPIPASKIDWTHQGPPLPVKLTLGTMIAGLGFIVSAISLAAAFYWGVKTHIGDQRIHNPPDGVPWGVKAKYEPATDARRARKAIVDRMAREHERLRTEQRAARDAILTAIRARPRRR